MEQSPSWEANSKLCSYSRNSPHLWKPKVPHRTHKCPPTLPILSQLHPVSTTPSNFLKIHLNVILSSTSCFPQWSIFLRLPYQHPVHTSILPHTRHMPCPSHSFRFYSPHNIEDNHYTSLNFNLHQFTSLHFSKLQSPFSLPYTFGLFVTMLRYPSLLLTYTYIMNFLTLFFKLCNLQGKVVSASACSWFHSLIVLFTMQYFTISVPCFLTIVIVPT
jgi:hypothetical protein